MPGRRLGVGSHRRLAGRIPGRMLGEKTVLRDQKPADLRKKGPPGAARRPHQSSPFFTFSQIFPDPVFPGFT